ncbi:LysR family transcriptional regulator [Maritimibacter sp. UBA3975]|uniref:LysR family transcriptional regulator n=1 Tax=Maritimibacter sp. UBA3975 TaxID=1946833 RepID=UPI000C09BAB8|nr:LysR family transcriptional regulator [Maritimibacter sp. UBA3975]MAM63049.1 LysR family transcriptional regulator [Maritimibacter sp.]|tara:strand:+ start:19583 stop:20461 length:879 start_codon:yes stop_codon:yes gene_type:complete
MTSDIDLNAMMLFYRTYNAGSINRAAAEMDMPKSTISRKLRALERQFGATLLRRGTRRLSLTEIGTAVHARCEIIAAELEDANFQAAEMQGGMRGALRLSMPVFLMSWSGPMLSAFAEENPGLRLEIEAHNRWVDLTEEAFDIAIHFGEPRETFQPTRRLAWLDRHLYAAPAYLDRYGTPESVADLRDHEIVMHYYQKRDAVWPPDMDISRPRAVVNSADVVHGMVRDGLGIGLLPDFLCRSSVAAGELVALDVGWRAPSLMLSATYLERRYATRKSKLFLDRISVFLKEHA